MFSTERGRFEKPKFEPHIVNNLRRDLKEERQKREKIEGEYNVLKKDTKITKINEIEVELQNYMSECKRLTAIISEEYNSQKNDEILTSYQQKSLSLEDKLKAKYAETSSLQSEIVRKNNEIKKLNERINEHAKQTDYQHKDKSEKEIQLQNKLTSIEKEMNSLAKNNDSLKNDASKAKGDLFKLSEEYENYRKTKETELSQAKAEFEKYKQQTQQSKDKYEVEENVDEEAQKQIQLYKEEAKSKQNTIEKLQSEANSNIESLQLKIKEYERQNNEYVKSIEKLQINITKQEAGIPIVTKELVSHLKTIMKIVMQVNGIQYIDAPNYITPASTYSIAYLIEEFKSKFLFDAESSKLLSRCLVEKGEGNGKVTYDPSAEITQDEYRKRYTKFLGKYTIYNKDDEDHYLTRIRKKYSKVPDTINSKFIKHDINKDGAIGTAKAISILRKHSNFTREEISYLLYHVIKNDPKNPNVCSYENIFKVMLEQSLQPPKQENQQKIEGPNIKQEEDLYENEGFSDQNIEQPKKEEKPKEIAKDTPEEPEYPEYNEAIDDEEEKEKEKTKEIAKNTEEHNANDNKQTNEQIKMEEEYYSEKENKTQSQHKEEKQEEPTKAEIQPIAQIKDTHAFISAARKVLKANSTDIASLFQNEILVNNGNNVIAKQAFHNKFTELGLLLNYTEALLPYSYSDTEYKYDEIVSLFNAHKRMPVSAELLKALNQYIQSCNDQQKGPLSEFLLNTRMIQENVGKKVKEVQVVDKNMLINMLTGLSIPDVDISILLNSTKEYIIIKKLKAALEQAEAPISYKIEEVIGKLISQKNKRLFELILESIQSENQIQARNLIAILSTNTTLSQPEIEFYVAHYADQTSQSVDINKIFTDLQFNKEEFMQLNSKPTENIEQQPKLEELNINTIIDKIREQKCKRLIEHISDNSLEGIIASDKLVILLSINTSLTSQEINYYVSQVSDDHTNTGNIEIQTIFTHLQHSVLPKNEIKPTEIPIEKGNIAEPNIQCDMDQIIAKIVEKKSKRLIEHITDNSTEGKIQTAKLLTILSINTDITQQELEYYAINRSNDKQLSGEAEISQIFKDIQHLIEPHNEVKIIETKHDEEDNTEKQDNNEIQGIGLKEQLSEIKEDVIESHDQYNNIIKDFQFAGKDEKYNENDIETEKPEQKKVEVIEEIAKSEEISTPQADNKKQTNQINEIKEIIEIKEDKKETENDLIEDEFLLSQEDVQKQEPAKEEKQSVQTAKIEEKQITEEAKPAQKTSEVVTKKEDTPNIEIKKEEAKKPSSNENAPTLLGGTNEGTKALAERNDVYCI